MGAIPALYTRPLMVKETFLENFHQDKWPPKTYLCYEVERLEGDAWIPEEEHKGFLRNEPGSHAELCLLDQISSWMLDKNLQYRVTCYISWSPCHDCAVNLPEFLRENSHVRLHIVASRIYTKDEYEPGLRALQEAGAQVSIMTPAEFEHCWETFVDHQGTPFPRWDNIDENCQRLSMTLKRILQGH